MRPAGHRVHGERHIALSSAGEYADVLEKRGYVIADFERRRELVRAGVEAEARRPAGRSSTVSPFTTK